MVEFTRIADLRQAVRDARASQKTIGFVPTMGYLHPGHMALVAAAQRECDFVVVSIFVNPLQFGPNEDYDRYPRDLARDEAMLREAGVDALFAPAVDEIYPEPMRTHVAVPSLSGHLEGAARPSHFQGVATVVTKLFHIVQPDGAYFGQKDAQQVAVVRRLVLDLSLPVEIRVVPTVREPDGLAMSSRNVYLRPEERPAALRLHAALEAGRTAIEGGARDAAAVREAMRTVLETDARVEISYAEVLDPTSLQPLARVQGDVLVLLAVAARVGRVRLLDNVVVRAAGRGAS